MANLLKIGYLYRDQGKINALLSTISSTDVTVEWNAKESRIDIIWEWNQEGEVQKLLLLINERFKETTVEIDNDEYRVETTEKEELRIDETESNETPVISYENEVSKEKTEEAKSHLETYEDVSKETEASEFQVESENSDATIEKIEADVSLENISKETKIPETPSVENCTTKSSLTKNAYTREEFEAEIKKLFELSKYDFSKDAPKVATEFCSDYDIKSDILKIAITLAKASPGRDELIKALAKGCKKNPARVKVELKMDFKRWFSAKYEAFVQTYSAVDVFDFLNIFREENRKF